MISGAGAASAGGAVVPIIEAAPAQISAIAPVTSWQGAYAGGSLGYSFGSDDEVGLQASDDDGLLGRATDIVNVKIGGVTRAVHAGYRWQRNNWVLGPSLSIEGGSVDDSESGSFSLDGFDYDTTVSNETRYLVNLTLKTGYLVNPATLVYGIAGISRGEFNYSFETTGTAPGAVVTSSSSEDFGTTGYVVGLGIERAINQRISAFGQYTYHEYDSTDIRTPLAVGEGSTRVTAKHSNIAVGVNFKF